MAKSSGFVSVVIKRSIVIDQHKTSVSLEDRFWRTLKHIAGSEEKTLGQLVAEIDRIRLKRGQTNLSSALRLHVLDWALEQADLIEAPTEMSHG